YLQPHSGRKSIGRIRRLKHFHFKVSVIYSGATGVFFQRFSVYLQDAAGNDSHLHVVPAGNLQSPSGLRRAEKSHDRFNILGKRRVQPWGVISSGGSSVAKPYELYLPFDLARIR